MALIHIAIRLLVSIRHDDMTTEGFNLWAVSTQQDDTISKLTMRSVSHRVPVPFRRTSSGLRGMMLHSENINGWTYFM